MVVEEMQEESSLFHQGGGPAQKKCSLTFVLRQQQMPAGLVRLVRFPNPYCVSQLENLTRLGWSHPSGRKSTTGMGISILRQLGELLHKADGIVAGKCVWSVDESG